MVAFAGCGERSFAEGLIERLSQKPRVDLARIVPLMRFYSCLEAFKEQTRVTHAIRATCNGQA
jgi:hypothetical protein